jgi:hypothetical protein
MSNRTRAMSKMFLVLAALLPALGCGTPVSGETTIDEIEADDFNMIECSCSCEVPISGSAVSEMGCGLSGGSLQSFDDGTPSCLTAKTLSACIQPELVEAGADLGEYCDMVCSTTEGGLKATFGCESTCTQVVPASDYQLHNASTCLDECEPEPCEACDSVPIGDFKDCLTACNSTSGVCGDDPVGPMCINTVDPPGKQWIDHSGGIVGDIIGYEAKGIVAAGSTAELGIDGNWTTVDVGGTVSVIGPPCEGSTCTSAIRVGFELGGFPLPGPFPTIDVENITVTGMTAINAIALDSSGHGEILPGDFTAVLRFELGGWVPFPPFVVDEALAYEFTNDVALPVYVDWSAGTVSLDGGMAGEIDVASLPYTFDIDFDVQGSFSQTGPQFDTVTLPTWAECDTPDGARIAVDATGTDREQSSGFLYRWWTSPDIFSASPDLETAGGHLIVPLGDHDVTVFIGDSTGRGTFHRDTVQVRDMRIAAMEEPWRGSGGMSIALRPSRVATGFPIGEFQALYADDCDAAPDVRITEVRPKTDGKKSDRSSRSILHEIEGGLCVDAVKSKRGIIMDYEVGVVVTDASGNTLEDRVMVSLCTDPKRCELPIFETRLRPFHSESCKTETER